MEEKKDVFIGQDIFKNFIEFQNSLLRFWENLFGAHIPPAAKGFNVENLFKGKHFQELYEKLEKVQETYRKLYKLWLPLGKKVLTVKDIKETPELYNQFLEVSLDACREIMDSLFGPLMPNYFRRYVEKLYEISVLVPGDVVSFSRPWFQMMINVMEMLPDIVRGDTESIRKINDFWWDAYSNTFDKLMRGVLMGMYREKVEKILKVLDGFIQYSLAFADFSTEIHKAAFTSVEKFSLKVVELGDADFFTFYKTWIETSEETFIELFKTDKFGHLLNSLNTYSMKFKKALDDFVEEAIKELPIPVRTEMDHLYKTIYDMRMKLKRLEKSVMSIKDKISKEGK